MTRFTALAWLFASACPAFADTITIPLPPGVTAVTTSAHYDCAGTVVGVDYVNAGNISLAILTIRGETTVAANVVAASGAKYAGGRYIWWTKGDGADLYDIQTDENAPPIACSAAT